MKRSLWILAIIFVVLPNVCAEAAIVYYRASDLVALMPKYETVMGGQFNPINMEMVLDYSRCTFEYMAYILGVYDATSSQYSVPSTADRKQIVAVTSKYIKEHPERWGEPAHILVINALKEAFPKEHTE